MLVSIAENPLVERLAACAQAALQGYVHTQLSLRAFGLFLYSHTLNHDIDTVTHMTQLVVELELHK
jgi:hypothetical protein